tara:strand:+ start:2086 stop:2694 length:609 start_codon:yes stop_codon:yes gene_type:complete
MTFVVTEACIKCKYTDCVEVCPVDCFYEGPNFLVIHPDECIDCGLCEPECPIEAILADDELPNDQIEFIEINAKLADVYPNISEAKAPLPEADEYKDVKDKKHFLNLDTSDKGVQNDIAVKSNEIFLYSSGELEINNIKIEIKDISNIDESIFRNTLIDNLKKEEIVHLNVQGKAFHEWAMKIMEFLQSNDFTDVKLKTLED